MYLVDGVKSLILADPAHDFKIAFIATFLSYDEYINLIVASDYTILEYWD